MSFMTQRAQRAGQVSAGDGQAEEGSCSDVLDLNIREMESSEQLDIGVWKNSQEVGSPTGTGSPQPRAVGRRQDGRAGPGRGAVLVWERWLPARCGSRRLP